MPRIYIGGAGGAPSNNVIRSLRESGLDYIIGASSNAIDLLLADVDERHVVPRADNELYGDRLLSLLATTHPELLHVQNDAEVLAVSRLREKIHALGVRTFLPSAAAVEVFVDKWQSYLRWHEAGLPLPRTYLIRDQEDLRRSFAELGGQVWLRSTTGGGGRGALPTNDPVFAERWIDRMAGWGTFTAAEQLTSHSVTWISLWANGSLVAGQTRRRLAWGFADRTLSGVTGVTAVGETMSSTKIASLGQQAINAVEVNPQGIYGVDMTYGFDGDAKLTEVNVGRFFTTVYFFTRAGFNFPRLYVDLALDRVEPPPRPILDPLEPGLLWLRGMDSSPVLTRHEQLRALVEGLE